MTFSGAVHRLRQLMVGDHNERKSVLFLLRMKLHGVDLSPRSLKSLGLTEARSIWYTNSGGPDLDAVLRALPIFSSDVALDLGCGKGGVMLTLAKYPFARVDGVEISPELTRIAERNLTRAGVSNACVYCCDAAEFTDVDPYTFFYMYNPFPEVVVRDVLHNIVESVSRRRRNLTLVYKNPVCHDLVVSAGFSWTSQFDHSDLPIHVYTLKESMSD